MPDFVFVCGVPRSGTTLFAKLLNLHPKIVVGIERFKHLALKQATNAQFTPDLFRQDRFFDFRPDDTNIVREYDATKYANASWVGDKVPRYYRHARTIFDRFPGAHLFYVLRDVEAVARSWNHRASNVLDSWPEHNDERRAVEEWNVGNRIALRQLREHPDHFHVVSYEDLCSGNTKAMAASLAKLGLKPTREIEELALTTSSRHAPLLEDVRLELAQSANFDFFEELTQHKL